eukprot:gnl/MRDRNA2_/MRDRNA2_96195_c0_seq1.p1 gnl/MRDRNA2_/MRDRNA2_96195_c0~~gnl/MRDRNA2_/MRDRNA2_96195_c0_seq1.p1  ORF type:complete len:216 (+),score=57.67 gnl/MRDRNA2_/MRDRNA2_96195_c0_seq1:739-1386(+)
MNAWEKDQGTSGTLVNLMGDPCSDLTNALGLVLDHPGPMSVLGNPRCKRFSMLIEDGIIKTINVAASEDDPAGDAAPEVSMVEKMLEDCKSSTYVGATPKSEAAPDPPKPEKIEDPAKFVSDAMKKGGISVFAKTYCPYCQNALKIMEEENADMTVYQLDLFQEPANGPVQQELNKMTGTLSVPQIFVDGKFIGGASDIEKLKADGTLKETLEKR